MSMIDAIKYDIAFILHKSYGNKWIEYLIKPAIPSPDRFISAKYSITLEDVAQIKNMMFLENNGAHVYSQMQYAPAYNK